MMRLDFWIWPVDFQYGCPLWVKSRHVRVMSALPPVTEFGRRIRVGEYDEDCQGKHSRLGGEQSWIATGGNEWRSKVGIGRGRKVGTV